MAWQQACLWTSPLPHTVWCGGRPASVSLGPTRALQGRRVSLSVGLSFSTSTAWHGSWQVSGCLLTLLLTSTVITTALGYLMTSLSGTPALQPEEVPAQGKSAHLTWYVKIPPEFSRRANGHLISAITLTCKASYLRFSDWVTHRSWHRQTTGGCFASQTEPSWLCNSSYVLVIAHLEQDGCSSDS